jgi:hypothetical protein
MAEVYAEQNVLRMLARPNWRRTTTEDLVCLIEECQDDLNNLSIYILFARIPDGCSNEEWLDDQQYYHEQKIAGLQEEIERRRALDYKGVMHTNKEIIQTIKNTIRIEDVLAWYTDVFLFKKTWTYRCTLHGPDKEPSGVIYKDDGHCHCFACQKGGDIFDVVQAFERIDLPAAIATLARHIGLDIKAVKSDTKPFGLEL